VERLKALPGNNRLPRFDHLQKRKPAPSSARTALPGIVLILAVGAALAHAGMLFFYTEDDHYIAAAMPGTSRTGSDSSSMMGARVGMHDDASPAPAGAPASIGILHSCRQGHRDGVGRCVLCSLQRSGRALRPPDPGCAGTSVIAAMGRWHSGRSGARDALFAGLVFGALAAASGERQVRATHSALCTAAPGGDPDQIRCPSICPVLLARWDRPIKRQAWWLTFFGIGSSSLDNSRAYFHACSRTACSAR